MLTLMIGMMLAFVLGAVTVLGTFLMLAPAKKHTQRENVAFEATNKPAEPAELTPEKKAEAEYITQMANMLKYDGTAQGKNT